MSNERKSGLKRIAVVGGGITGLAAAHRLVELSRSREAQLNLTLFEATARLGGIISTHRRDGFLIESGSDAFITNKPWAVDLCRRLGLADRLIPTNEAFRRTLVVHRGKLHSIPGDFLLLAPARIWPVLRSPLFSWRGKLRIALEPTVPRAPEGADESLARFATRRFGREAFERLIQPLVGGIYTADPDKLSVRATLPRFLEMEREHGSLIRGLRRERRDKPLATAGASGARYGLFVTLDDGLQSLVEALQQRLPPGSVRCEARVAAITPVTQESSEGSTPREEPPPSGEPARFAQRWQVRLADGTSLTADAVILALPAFRAAGLLRGFEPRLSGMLEGIPYASSAIVVAAYRRQDVVHPLDAFGLIVPVTEGRAILAASFSSVKFPGRAPEGSVLVRVFLGGALDPGKMQLSDQELEEVVKQELGDLLGTKGDPLFTEVARHSRAMPQYHVGHLERIAAISNLIEKWPGLRLAGNAYHGVGIPDCIHSGEQAAESVWKSLVGREGAGSAAMPADSLPPQSTG